MQPVSRRTVLRGSAGLLAALTLAGCAEDDTEGVRDGVLDQIDVTVAVFPSMNSTAAAVAQDEGIFARVGLAVGLEVLGTPGQAIPQVLGGQVHFALVDLTAPLIAMGKGVPIVYVAAGVVGRPPTEPGRLGFGNIWVRPESPITTIRDLERATFALPEINSQIWVTIRRAVDEAGGDSSRIRFLEAPNTVAALKAGQVDAITTSEPVGTLCLDDPAMRFLAANPSRGMTTAFISSMRFARRNPDTVLAFRAAMLEANRRVNSDSAVRVEAATSIMQADPALIARSVFPHFSEVPLTPEDILDSTSAMQRYGLLPESVPTPVEALFV